MVPPTLQLNKNNNRSFLINPLDRVEIIINTNKKK